MADHHEWIVRGNAERLGDLALQLSIVAAHMCEPAKHITMPAYRTVLEGDLDRARASLQRCIDTIDEVKATLRPKTVTNQLEAAE